MKNPVKHRIKRMQRYLTSSSYLAARPLVDGGLLHIAWRRLINEKEIPAALKLSELKVAGAAVAENARCLRNGSVTSDSSSKWTSFDPRWRFLLLAMG